MEATEIKLIAVQDAPHHRSLLGQEGIPFEQISLREYPGCFFLGFSVDHEYHFLDALWPPGFEVGSEMTIRHNTQESVELLKAERLPGYPGSLASRPMGIRRLYEQAAKKDSERRIIRSFRLTYINCEGYQDERIAVDSLKEAKTRAGVLKEKILNYDETARDFKIYWKEITL